VPGEAAAQTMTGRIVRSKCLFYQATTLKIDRAKDGEVDTHSFSVPKALLFSISSFQYLFTFLILCIYFFNKTICYLYLLSFHYYLFYFCI